jgi:DNA-binding response OmpR family regulator
MTTFDDGKLHIDYEQQEVTVGGKHVDLIPGEYQLLAALTCQEGQALSYEQLMGLGRYDDDRWVAVKYNVVLLRRKLGFDDTGADDSQLEHVPGDGYRWRSRPS